MDIGLSVTVGGPSNIAAVSDFDPEAGLSLSHSFVAGELITATHLNRTSAAVFAIDFAGLNGSAGGLIAEFGGSTIGGYIGFRPNGDFIARCGDSDVVGPPFGAAATGFVLNAPTVVSGDGTLVVEFVPGAVVSARAWWNGVALSGAAQSLSGRSDWTGGADGGYLLYSGSAPQVGEVVDTIVAHSSASAMRYYAAQTVVG